jgi:hypothetical protein
MLAFVRYRKSGRPDKQPEPLFMVTVKLPGDSLRIRPPKESENRAL